MRAIMVGDGKPGRPVGRRDEVIRLLQQGLPVREIAERTGVSRQYVYDVRYRYDIRSTEQITSCQAALWAYRRAIQRTVPVGERVRVLARLLGGPNAIAALRALEYIDWIAGVSTARHLEDAQPAQHRDQPMIIIGGDARVMIAVSRDGAKDILPAPPPETQSDQ
jgi:hypothetical protein